MKKLFLLFAIPFFAVLADTPKSKVNFLVPGQYVGDSLTNEWSGVRKAVVIKANEGFNSYLLSGFFSNQIRVAPRINWEGSEEVELTYDKKSQIFRGALNMSHYINGCPWKYEIKIAAFFDKLEVAELYPKDISNHTGKCVMTGYDWHFHKAPLFLHDNSVAKAYEAALANENDPKKQQELKLFVAVSKGDVEYIQNAIGTTDFNVVDWKGRNPLMVAGAFDQDKIWELLLPVTDLNTVDADGKSIMQYALYPLPSIASKVSVESQVNRSRQLLHIKFDKKLWWSEALVWSTSRLESAPYVIDYIIVDLPQAIVDKALTTINRSWFETKPTTASGLKAAEALLNYPTTEKANTLFVMEACKYNNKDFVALGMKYKQESTFKDSRQWNLLAYLIDSGFNESTLAAINGGADVNATVDDTNEPLLMFAAKRHFIPKLEVLKALVEKGALVNATNKNGLSTLDAVTQVIFELTYRYQYLPKDADFLYVVQTYRYLVSQGAKNVKYQAPPEWIFPH